MQTLSLAVALLGWALSIACFVGLGALLHDVRALRAEVRRLRRRVRRRADARGRRQPVDRGVTTGQTGIGPVSA